MNIKKDEKRNNFLLFPFSGRHIKAAVDDFVEQFNENFHSKISSALKLGNFSKTIQERSNSGF